MEITVNQIYDILERSFEDYKKSGKSNNIMLIGHEGYGRSSAVEHWVNSHPEVSLYHLEPSVCGRVENGFLKLNKANGGNHYAFDDFGLENLSKGNRVYLIERLNWAKERSYEQVNEIIKLVSMRHYISGSGQEYDLGNIPFVVVTVFPEDGLNHTLTMAPEFVELFTKYEVHPSLKETAEFLIKDMKQREDAAKKAPEFQINLEELHRMGVTDEELEKDRKLRYSILESFSKVDAKMPVAIRPCDISNCLGLAESEKDYVNRLTESAKGHRKGVLDSEAQEFLNVVIKALLNE